MTSTLGFLRICAVCLDHRLLAALGEDATAALLIKDAAVGFAGLEVGLIAGDDRAVLAGLHFLAAVLHAGVALLDAVFEGQLEVSRPRRPVQTRKVLCLIFGIARRSGLAGDGAILTVQSSCCRPSRRGPCR